VARARTVLTPRWILFHFLIALLVVTMINLGLWQLRRLHQRKDFNAEVRARERIALAPLDQVVTDGVDPQAVEWRAVTATGTYLPDEQVLQINRTQGGRPGSNLLTPLRLADGRLLLVNRGFVADGDTAPPAPTGTVTVGGRLRASQGKIFGEISDPAEGDLAQVRRIDLRRLAPQMPAPLEPVYLERVTSQPAEPAVVLPLPDPELDNGPHLSYAIQWAIFSICAIGGWVYVVQRQLRAPDAAGSAGDGGSEVGGVAVADDAPVVGLDQEHLGDGGVAGPQVEGTGGGGLEGEA
jgi:cytochrome oxidase assembly protein ShyY1